MLYVTLLMIQIAASFATAILVIADVLPAALCAIVPFAYALCRRKNWIGVGLLLATAVTALSFFILFMLVLLSL